MVDLRSAAAGSAAESIGDAKRQIIYVTGTGRSGSTLLGSLLAATPGAIHVGEARYIWERGFVHQRLCACGNAFGNCSFWSRVTKRLSPETIKAAPKISRLMRQHIRLRSDFVSNTTPVELSLLQTALAELYSAIGEVSGCNVIVDTSKLPTYGKLLQSAVDAEFRILHLTRDPRAAAHSWANPRAVPDKAERRMQKLGTFKSSALWTYWNRMAEKTWSGDTNYMHLRFEDLVAWPEASLSRVADWCGLDKEQIAEGIKYTASGVVVRKGANFGVAGNPNRFSHGEVTLRADDRWHTQMNNKSKVLATLTSLPRLRKCGYDIKGTKS